ncbi:hypothetical protein M569_16382 [Genlisea aurea]|uniref:DUF7054 domain-containing protein n=1 Tax=Genlisea aurea TaxID=192259 RepID=S8DGF3_9LAMI|nr:hypothetical protein M569_16382 [Genlisea aurea]
MELKAKKPKAAEEAKKSDIRRSNSDKSFLPEAKKKRDDDVSKAAAQYNRFLVIINVYGSTGPIKFLVNGDSAVREVIEKTLKIYASEGRLPAIGSVASADNFSLSAAENGSEVGGGDRVVWGEKVCSLQVANGAGAAARDGGEGGYEKGK